MPSAVWLISLSSVVNSPWSCLKEVSCSSSTTIIFRFGIGKKIPDLAEIVKSLLANGADPSIKDKSGNTPLKIADNFKDQIDDDFWYQHRNTLTKHKNCLKIPHS